MRLKKNEIVCYEDGKTEEYESGFHNLYPLYLTKEGDVYADYCGCDICDSIPMEQLSAFSADFCYRTVKSVQLNTDGKVSLTLINGQVIGKESES